MRIRLIEPGVKEGYLVQTPEDIKAYWFARLSLTTVAALTPPEFEVTITDENVEPIDFDEPADLVGITAMTHHAERAYDIARRLRAQGTPVVMGGIHASSLPEEAKEHVDAVVIGEAEETWVQLLRDFQAGELKPFYASKGLCSLANQPRPRIDLLRQDAYATVACVQASRGCPFKCDFCSVTTFFGNTYRLRPVDEVIEEVKQLPDGYVTFVDDNIIGNPSYAKELFRKLAPLKKQWVGQSSLTLARDPELMNLARESGCYALFFGIESLFQGNLSSMKKSFNQVSDYEEAIRTIHGHGIAVIGSFILGFDHDDESVFERTVRFCEKNGIELPIYFVLTPIPGTPFFKEMEREGRLLHRNWEEYDGMRVVFKPKLMSEDTLQKGFYWTYHETYSYPSIAKRILLRPKNRLIPLAGLNMAFRKMILRAPEGSLGTLSQVLAKLNTTIPIKDRGNLIPTFVDSTLEKGQQMLKEASDFLKVRAFNNERLRTIFIQLEGSLDFQSAKKLIKRIEMTVKRSQEKIVVDFKGVTFLSPNAASLLISDKLERLRKVGDSIRFVHLSARAAGMLDHLRERLHEWETVEEEGRSPL